MSISHMNFIFLPSFSSNSSSTRSAQMNCHPVLQASHVIQREGCWLNSLRAGLIQRFLQYYIAFIIDGQLAQIHINFEHYACTSFL